LFSVPAFAPPTKHVSQAFSEHYRLGAVMTPYTEWYENALRVPESPSARHHAEHWAGRSYGEFRADFAAGLEHWRPAEWARLFRRAGAGYVVLVSKHHDGYCLWPSAVPNPNRGGWHTERDVVGELADAVRAEGMRFGVYYSGGIDWSWNPEPVRTLLEFVSSVPRGAYPVYAEAQVRELISRYRPSVLWNDIAWPTGKRAMLQLIADYYDAVEEGVVNDRWMHYGVALRLLGVGALRRALDRVLERRIRRDVESGRHNPGIVPPEPVHCDFRTPEYTSFPRIREKKWEATRGMSPSFGFNRFDTEEDYEDPVGLVRSFVDVVSKNGNLLLNVGPRGVDAGIPEPQVRRLELLGSWLEHSGEAIYETRPWKRADAQASDGSEVRFTEKNQTVYAIVLGRLEGPSLSFDLPGDLPPNLTCRRVRDGAPVPVRVLGRRIELRELGGGGDSIATAFALEPPSEPGKFRT
jgi:alpha-L-fucosidase